MNINGPRAIRLASAILVGALACAAGQARQAGRRVIGPAPVEAGRQSPVEVVSVSVKGKAVGPGRPFDAGDDWLSGLTFTVKNVSDRPVTFVDISLRVPAAGGQRKTGSMVGPLRYGCWPGFPCYPDAEGSSAAILPGETRDVVLTEERAKSFVAGLAQVGAAMPVESAEYDIDSAFFDADTRWSRGLVFRRDPSEPDTYRMEGKYVLPKKSN
jgi:hypothetical protein